MVNAYYFSTGYGKYRILAGALHTALHTLGELLESETKGRMTWKKIGKYNFHIILDCITKKEDFIKGYQGERKIA